MPIFDKNTAKIKMVGLTKIGMSNIVWYNREKDNNKTPEQIIEKMYKNFCKYKDRDKVQVLQFYDNRSGNQKPLVEYKS